MMKPPKPEWRFEVEMTDIGNAPAHYVITANSESCDDLAERFGILGLKNAAADLTILRERGGAVVHVTGQVSADVVQECVVTLDPVESRVSDLVDAYFTDRDDIVSFARANAQRAARKGIAVDVEMVDESTDPERVTNGKINLGEVAAQFLSLALDPYPRRVDWESAAPRLLHDASGVAYGTDQDMQGDNDTAAPMPEAAETQHSPFAALKQWKEGL